MGSMAWSYPPAAYFETEGLLFDIKWDDNA